VWQVEAMSLSASRGKRGVEPNFNESKGLYRKCNVKSIAIVKHLKEHNNKKTKRRGEENILI
jgi:hypothetical protein